MEHLLSSVTMGIHQIAVKREFQVKHKQCYKYEGKFQVHITQAYL